MIKSDIIRIYYVSERSVHERLIGKIPSCVLAWFDQFRQIFNLFTQRVNLHMLYLFRSQTLTKKGT